MILGQFLWFEMLSKDPYFITFERSCSEKNVKAHAFLCHKLLFCHINLV